MDELKESLLKPTKLYSKFAQNPNILETVLGFAHITGGGITDNLPRILTNGITAKIQLSSWTVPKSIKWAISNAGLSEVQALQTFNCGIGLIAIIPANKKIAFESYSKQITEPVMKIGEIVKGTKIEFQGSLNID